MTAEIVETVPEDTEAEPPRWQPAPFVGDRFVVVLPPMLVNVLDSLCEGKSNREIGRDWGIAEDTVKTHLKRLYAKIGARDRTHLVALTYSGAIDVRLKPGKGTHYGSGAVDIYDVL